MLQKSVCGRLLRSLGSAALPCRLIVIQFWLLSYMCATVQPLSVTPWPEIIPMSKPQWHLAVNGSVHVVSISVYSEPPPKHTQPVQGNAEGKRGNGSDRGDCCRERGGVRLITHSVSLSTAAHRSEG